MVTDAAAVFTVFPYGLKGITVMTAASKLNTLDLVPTTAATVSTGLRA